MRKIVAIAILLAACGHGPFFAAFDRLEFAAQLADPLFDEAAVDFQLLFARPTHADPHFQSG